MSYLTDGKFWAATGERVVATFAGAEAAFLLAGGTGVLDTDWVTSLSVSGMAAVLSLLKCVAAGKVGDAGPSLTSAESIDPTL